MSSWRDLLLSAAPDDASKIPGLALGVELRLRESAAVAHWGPRRVRTATAGDLSVPGADLLVGLRPLARGSGDGWVRSGLSWDRLRRGGVQTSEAQRTWFTELYGIAHDVRILAGLRDDSEWLTLDTITSPLLWPHLALAVDRGIPLVSAARRQAVALSEPAVASIRVSGDRRGGFRLAPEISLGDDILDASTLHPIGRTGVYAARAHRGGIRLSLIPVPLGDGVHTLLSTRDRVVVPAGEVAEFAREALPRLSRQGPVLAAPGVTLPDPDPTSLVLTVSFRGGDTLDYRFEWLREGTTRQPWTAHQDGDGAESDLRDQIGEVWLLAPEQTFAGSATLTGADSAEFAAHLLPALEQLDGVRVETRGHRREYRELRGAPRITVKTVESDDPDWFDLGVIVEIDGRNIPFTPLFTALALRHRKLLLTDGSYFSLAHPALDRLRILLEEAAEIAEWDNTPSISRYQLPLWEDFEDLADEAQPAVAWRAAAAELRHSAAADPTAVPAGLRAELRPYQREGLDRLALWWRHRLGGVLADDMGLGKTLQVLALLLHVKDEGERRPFLVVAPTSVLPTWREEAARFAPDLRVRVHDATIGTSRVAPGDAGADVVVTSYGILRHDEVAFAAVDWAIVILDEAQFVKNPATRQHRAVQSLHADMMLAVTGTPLENSLAELWAIFSLTCPGLFPSARRFRQEYTKPIEQGKVAENQAGAPYRERRLQRLRSRVRPFLLRRTKELVAPELPPRQEQQLRVELSPAHRAVYDRVLQRERQKILGLLTDLDRNRFIVFRSLTLLRRLALAPVLVDAGDAGIRSAKLDALRERLREVIAEGHRALVFSQFTSYLDLVRADLAAHGIAYDYLDGSTRRRGEVVEGFRGGEAPVFLISLKAGGFGLTLTEADYVFLLDPWWNPAAEAQAIDRTHRIGQTRPVHVYRLIASDTIEDKVVELQQRKAGLFRSVMGEDDLLARSLTPDDVRALLEP